MKKMSFAAFAVMALLASCGQSQKGNESKVEETPVAGTSFVITKTTSPTGTVVFGVKQGDKQIVPATYAGITYDHGYFIANEVGEIAEIAFSRMVLVDPATGAGVFGGDELTFEENGGYFVAKQNDKVGVYFPGTKTGFGALKEYVVVPDCGVILAKSFEEWGAFTTKNDTILGPYYKEIVVQPRDGKANYFIKQEQGWLRLDEKGEAVAQATAAELKAMKKQKAQVKKDAFVMK